MNGKKINLSTLSDEELLELHKNIKEQESKIKRIIDQYQEKYPFLRE